MEYRYTQEGEELTKKALRQIYDYCMTNIKPYLGQGESLWVSFSDDKEYGYERFYHFGITLDGRLCGGIGNRDMYFEENTKESIYNKVDGFDFVQRWSYIKQQLLKELDKKLAEQKKIENLLNNFEV